MGSIYVYLRHEPTSLGTGLKTLTTEVSIVCI